MPSAIKQIVTVQRGGRIEVFVPELPEGTAAEVTVMQTAPRPSNRSLAAIIGKGQGAFSSPREVDQFIRAERDEWA